MNVQIPRSRLPHPLRHAKGWVSTGPWVSNRQSAFKRTSPNLNVFQQAADLLADAQLRDNRLVTLGIVLLQVIQQATPSAYHHQQAAPGGVVLLMRFEVVGQLANTLAQDRDLHFRAAGISRVRAIAVDNRFLMLSG